MVGGGADLGQEKEKQKITMWLASVHVYMRVGQYAHVDMSISQVSPAVPSSPLLFLLF